MASFIRTPDHLTVVFDDGEIATVYPSNPSYDKVIEALNVKDWDTVRRLADPAVDIRQTIAEKFTSSDRVRIEGGIVYYDDKPMHNHLCDRMIAMRDEGLDIAPLSLFLENLMENSSFRAVHELYGFLEASNLPITEDGHFLAYKRINRNWTDAYTGKIDNSIGSVAEMPRNAVNEDKNNTCSDGLHFCAREYLPHYGAPEGGRVIIVKINPRDVVAIPSDYNNAKGRCCRYEVINELKMSSKDGRNAMPKATLEDTYRHSGTNVPETDADKRVLVQRGLDSGSEIATFVSPGEASRMTGINSSSISKVARGKRNSAGGYAWTYEYRNSIPITPEDADSESLDLDDDNYWPG